MPQVLESAKLDRAALIYGSSGSHTDDDDVDNGRVSSQAPRAEVPDGLEAAAAAIWAVGRRIKLRCLPCRLHRRSRSVYIEMSLDERAGLEGWPRRVERHRTMTLGGGGLRGFVCVVAVTCVANCTNCRSMT